MALSAAMAEEPEVRVIAVKAGPPAPVGVPVCGDSSPVLDSGPISAPASTDPTSSSSAGKRRVVAGAGEGAGVHGRRRAPTLQRDLLRPAVFVGPPGPMSTPVPPGSFHFFHLRLTGREELGKGMDAV
jgi:hypothetical protein